MAAIELVLGDITAGPRLARAGRALAPCEPGDAVATPAFDLDPPIRHVIHTVGPVWHGGHRGEAGVLASCYRRCLQVADGLSVHSTATSEPPYRNDAARAGSGRAARSMGHPRSRETYVRAH